MKTIIRNPLQMLAVTATTAVAMFGGIGASPALSQQNGNSASTDFNSKKVSIDVESGDIRFAIKLLFQSLEVNYTIAPDVQGPITVHLKDVPFKTALESMLKTSSVPLTYRVEAGIYSISVKNESAAATIESSKDDREDAVVNRKSDKIVTSIKLNFADPEDIAKFFGGSVFITKFGGSTALLGMGNRNGQGSGLGSGMGSGLGNGQSGLGGGSFGNNGGSFGSAGGSFGSSGGSFGNPGGGGSGNPGGGGNSNRR